MNDDLSPVDKNAAPSRRGLTIGILFAVFALIMGVLAYNKHEQQLANPNPSHPREQGRRALPIDETPQHLPEPQPNQ